MLRELSNQLSKEKTYKKFIKVTILPEIKIFYRVSILERVD